MANSIKIISVTLEPEKTTKNTVMFAEKPANDFVPEKIGVLYVPKSTLAEMKYNGGNIIVEIGKVGDVKMMPEKVTTNKVKFSEDAVSEFAPVKIGDAYIPKSTLAELGYTGDALYISVKLAK